MVHVEDGRNNCSNGPRSQVIMITADKGHGWLWKRTTVAVRGRSFMASYEAME